MHALHCTALFNQGKSSSCHATAAAAAAGTSQALGQLKRRFNPLTALPLKGDMKTSHPAALLPNQLLQSTRQLLKRQSRRAARRLWRLPCELTSCKATHLKKGTNSEQLVRPALPATDHDNTLGTTSTSFTSCCHHLVNTRSHDNIITSSPRQHEVTRQHHHLITSSTRGQHLVNTISTAQRARSNQHSNKNLQPSSGQHFRHYFCLCKRSTTCLLLYL
jgi:hypothetical protein